MLNIRDANAADAAPIRQLIAELAQYAGRSGEDRITEEELARDGFGDHPAFRVLIAEWDGVLAGFALYFSYYSTWRGRGLYLEDLFVRPEIRRQGIGKALLAAVARVAVSEKRSFVRWAVLDWNEPAIAMYSGVGAAFLDEWRTVLLAGDRLNELSSSCSELCSRD
jgi:GNAT superfamily N-acetyltransferase